MSKATSFLSVGHFARKLGVPSKRVARWCRERRIPYVQIGRTIKIPADALERLLTLSDAPQRVGDGR